MMRVSSATFSNLIKDVDVSPKSVNVIKGVSVYPYPKSNHLARYLFVIIPRQITFRECPYTFSS